MTPKQRTSFGYAIVSVALVLLLLGLIGLLYIQTNSLVNYFKENVSVLVEIKPESNDNQINILKKSVEISPFVKPGSLTYTSKERGAYLLSKEFGKDLSTFGFENPLYNIIQFKLKAGYEVQDSINHTKKVLSGNPLIQDVYVQEGMMSNINNYLKKGMLLAVGFALLFMLIAIALIYNTIRLALNSNLSLIWLFLSLMVIGILLNLLSTEMVLRKYLNMRIEEVY